VKSNGEVKSKGVVSALVVSLSLLLPYFLWGQGGQTGAIAGVVSDPSGAAVPNASVSIVDEGTGVSARRLTTGPDGAFVAGLLPPGSYRVEVSASGFAQKQSRNLQVRINGTTRVDISLEVGAISEVVEVEGAAVALNTERATTGQEVDNRTMNTLPLANPNVLFLLTLSPGTAGEMPDVRSANRGLVDINVNGQRTSNNSISINGINVNDFNLAHFDTVPLPNPNVLEEFKVSTSLYDATLGSKGGGALNLVMRSGSKDWHADAYWNMRNDDLNANEWFRNNVGAPRAKLLQNVFGGSASGPLPKLGGYWFANYQGIRGRNGLDPNGSVLNPTIPTLPTAADGSVTAAALASAYNLSPSQIDPVALNILNLKSSLYGGTYLIPRPGQPGCQTPPAGAASFRCTISEVTPVIDNQYTITYDRPFRMGKDNVAARWFWDNGQSQKPYGTASTLANPRTDPQDNRFLSLSETHIISPRLLNEFRAGFSRFISANQPTDVIALKDVGAARPNSGQFPGLYRVNISGLFSLGTGVNDDRGTVSNQFNYADTWSLTAGKHTLRAGGEVVRYQLNRYNRFASRGDLAFQATTGTGNAFSAFQNFLRGAPTSLQSAGGDPQRYFRATDGSLFIQDDYRANRRLTLNIGLRWELMQFGHDLYFRTAMYDPPRPLNPFVYPSDLALQGVTGTPGIGACGIPNCLPKGNFAPRVGFAWDVKGDHKTVVRGGFGLYYQRLSNQNILQGSLGAPFFVQPIDNRAVPDPLQLANPLPLPLPVGSVATAFIPAPSLFTGLRRVSGTGPLDPNDPNVAPIFTNPQGQACTNYGGTATNCSINLASFSTMPMNTYTPYTEQWNFTIQRDLGRGWALEAGYVGSHYLGGLGIWDPYLAPLASPQNPIKVTDTSGVTYMITTNTVNNEEVRNLVLGESRKRGQRLDSNLGQAIYHSAQVNLTHRFSRGLFMQLGYTWSKAIDNVSGSQSTDELNGNTSGSQNGSAIFNAQNSPQQNRARGDFDRPHRLIISYSYDLPLPKSGVWGTQAFQGWSVAGITTFQNGLPFSVVDTTTGGIFGGGVSTGQLICRPISEQVSGVPACTPGTAYSAAAAATSGTIQDRLNHYLNPNFFSASATAPNSAGPGATLYGTVPRNAFRGPFQQDWDFAVLKGFKLSEKGRVDFRADFFNLFNHPIFALPAAVTIPTPSTFGQITNTTIPARLIQFGLHLRI
jgi:hypothetical protein